MHSTEHERVDRGTPEGAGGAFRGSGESTDFGRRALSSWRARARNRPLEPREGRSAPGIDLAFRGPRREPAPEPKEPTPMRFDPLSDPRLFVPFQALRGLQRELERRALAQGAGRSNPMA